MEFTALFAGSPYVNLNELSFVAGAVGGVLITRFCGRGGSLKLGLVLAVAFGVLCGFLLAIDDPGRGLNVFRSATGERLKPPATFPPAPFQLDVALALRRMVFGFIGAFLGGSWICARVASRRRLNAKAAENAENTENIEELPSGAN